MYSVGNYGKCSKNSLQGSKTSSGKGKEIMEGIVSGTRWSGITYLANCQWLGKCGHWKQNQSSIVWWTR